MLGYGAVTNNPPNLSGLTQTNIYFVFALHNHVKFSRRQGLEEVIDGSWPLVDPGTWRLLTLSPVLETYV